MLDTASSPTEIPSSISVMRVIRRNGTATDYDPEKIRLALTKAFVAVEGSEATRIHGLVRKIAQAITQNFIKHARDVIHIEEIQDAVELSLMRLGEQKVARAYVLYREAHKKIREAHSPPVRPLIYIQKAGTNVALKDTSLHADIREACQGLQDVDADFILDETRKSLFKGATWQDAQKAVLMSARLKMEKSVDYSFAAARLLLSQLKEDAFSYLKIAQKKGDYADYFLAYIHKGIRLGLLDPRLKDFDLKKLAGYLDAERDLKFTYLGLQTLYDRYFLKEKDIRFELPQAFFMRVAMGLALAEKSKIEMWALKFYDVLSHFDFMSSTPTLFNSGTVRPQLASCFLTTVPDSLGGIYDSLKDNALLAKHAGGLGNDWTNVRALGSRVRGTHGRSQGVIPFLNVADATTIAVDQSGRRKGATCVYLETWHLDIEQFLELRKNTGDDRRRTHDMNTANWIPDLFMERVIDKSLWTLFSPDEVPGLHDATGQAFRELYEKYEADAQAGKIRSKQIKAVTLWRKMLGMLFETGHPWMTFKDACNVRSPQGHAGIVHSSNLCTEITLNTSEDEIAVCNLGSINLVNHLDKNKELASKKLKETIKIAVRMLDNAISANFYSVEKAKNSNMRHRPIGLGLMGFQDVLFEKRIAYASDAAVAFADRSMEQISYFAIEASSDLAKERGAYSSFEGSLWSKGILPIDSVALLRDARRAGQLKQNICTTLDWDTLRKKVKQEGMRHSNVLAIAPTATIANICGVSASIEPLFRNLFVKSNLSGEFTVINPYLVRDLKALNLWDEAMRHDLKYYEGSIQSIVRIPSELKELYQTSFEINPLWLIEAASARQKYICQSQSLNIYVPDASGKLLHNLYVQAWLLGIKTTYYLRTLAATAAEKSTIDTRELNAVATSAVCNLDEGCEACQ